MSLHILPEKNWFPPVEDALEDGLLAMGGDLSAARLLLAYRKGIFPWYEGDVPLWWCPDPRFVLFPQALNISKSMQQVLKKKQFSFTINQAFEQVIHQCKTVNTGKHGATWITDEVESAYTQLHRLGIAHSAETWLNGQLVGGLYGIRLGKVFFGESMFSLQSNASKFAFIRYTQDPIQHEVKLIDCQVYSSHLESLGAAMIQRSRFIELLDQLIT